MDTVSTYREQLTKGSTYFGYWLAGFLSAAIGGLAIGLVWYGVLAAALLGILVTFLGLMVVSIRTKYPERRGDMVCSSVMGIASFYCLEFLLVNNGVHLPSFSAFNAAFFGWHVFLFVVAILFIIFNLLWLYGLYLKTTPEEKEMVLHGDDWFGPDERKIRMEEGVTLDGTADEVWPYLIQSGQDKAGWYSFDWLERLCTFDIHNHYTIHPEWQNLKVGDYQWFHQAPYSIGEWVTELDNQEHYWAAHSDSRVDKNGPQGEKALRMPCFTHFAWTWNWYVYDIDESHCRFIFRCDCSFAPYTTFRKWFLAFLLGTASIVMSHGYMSCIRRIMNGTQKITEKTK